MVLGIPEAFGLALTSVGVSQLPVVAGAQATWRRFTFNFNDAYLPLHERLDTLEMQLRMFRRRADSVNQLPADFPESIAMEKLRQVGDAVNKAIVMCQEYEDLPIDAQNSWGRDKGQELQITIEGAERKLGLVARFAALRSQELVLEMAERVLRLEQYMEAKEKVSEGEGDAGEEAIPDQNLAENGEESAVQIVVYSYGEDRSSASRLAATVVWITVVLFSATVLVRVGHQL